MNSMTGYGRAEYTGDVVITAEIKTVNNRYFDLNAKYPRQFLALDDAIRKTVQKDFPRGHADLFVTFTDKREKTETLSVDAALAKAYLEAANQIAELTGKEAKLSVLDLMKCPDVVSREAQAAADEEIGDLLIKTIESAVQNLNRMRAVEGEKLKADMLSRVDTIEKAVEKIALRAPEILAAYREKLTKRVEEYLSGAPIDEGRILTEVAVFADKCNIDEELTRLRSHIKQFRTIAAGENAGKKLDFLVQEFNREANTICSKSNDAQTTDIALNIKCEIEKIREQVQNVE